MDLNDIPGWAPVALIVLLAALILGCWIGCIMAYAEQKREERDAYYRRIVREELERSER